MRHYFSAHVRELPLSDGGAPKGPRGARSSLSGCFGSVSNIDSRCDATCDSSGCIWPRKFTLATIFKISIANTRRFTKVPLSMTRMGPLEGLLELEQRSCWSWNRRLVGKPFTTVTTGAMHSSSPSAAMASPSMVVASPSTLADMYRLKNRLLPRCRMPNCRTAASIGRSSAVRI